MADLNRAASFAKHFQKHAGRAKELFRQNLGKADRTTDEDMEEYCKNFNKQTCSASRLLKEVRNYHNCVKAMQSANKALMDTICDLYEPSWVEYDKIQVKTEMLDKKCNEFQETVVDQVIKPLVAYSEQFPEVNNKILKRRRKLLDYDFCRHTIQNLEQHAKKREDAKIAKAKEQMMETQMLYETINQELLDELPALYDSRISFLASNMQCLFLAEMAFHNETAKIFSDLNDAVELLAAENQKGAYAIKRNSQHNSSSKESFFQDQGKNGEVDRSSSSEYMSAEAHENSAGGDRVKKDESSSSEGTLVAALEESTLEDLTFHTPCGVEEPKETETSFEDQNLGSNENLPKILYKVKAAFQYTAEDADELSFEPGEIINVIEFEDPDQQEDGWLMGFKEGTKMKGLFPSNFTKPM